jgi:two-component system alkaline phosphatase synthesis response regulator PhoP
VLRKETILVVEDEIAILDLIAAYLRADGFTVHTAQDGNNALKQARATRPTLVILDVMLPGIDGLEVCKQLQAEQQDVYVLMLTARAEEVDKIVGLSVGAGDYLTKPFSPRELVARVKAILRRRRQLSSRCRHRRRLPTCRPGLRLREWGTDRRSPDRRRLGGMDAVRSLARAPRR